MSSLRPRVRERDLVIRDLGDEVVVYDLASHRGHCLNRTATLVWRACNGQRSVSAIAVRVGREIGVPGDEALVRFALKRLGTAGLLASPAPERAVTRREVARRIGVAALLPVVASMLAPTPAQAATCEAGCPTCNCAGQPNGTTCWNGVDCTSYVCCNGSCLPPQPCI